jgi:hypothetical protein
MWRTVEGGNKLLHRDDWTAIGASTVFVTPLLAYGLGLFADYLLPYGLKIGLVGFYLRLLFAHAFAPIITIFLRACDIHSIAGSQDRLGRLGHRNSLACSPLLRRGNRRFPGPSWYTD